MTPEPRSRAVPRGFRAIRHRRRRRHERRVAGIGRHDRQRALLAVAEPLLALVCFENNARTLPIVREAGRFGVNVLSADQEDVAEVFASKVPESEKLEAVPHRYEAGVPIIEGALSWAVCTLRELIAGGDHTIAIGEVVAMGLGEGTPLLWYGGQYHDVGSWRSANAARSATASRGDWCERPRTECRSRVSQVADRPTPPTRPVP